MSLRDVKINSEYRTLRNDVVKEFYIPVLREANEYKRAVGFFSSTSLIEISYGISGLVKNNGKIRLIASPKLSKEDIDAIEKGYELRDKIIEDALIRELCQVDDFYGEQRLNLLANLISTGILEIKIAIVNNQSEIGMYHEKVGIISDSQNNKIAFTGSMNESITAIKYNYESIDVFCSWTIDNDRVEVKNDAFERLWNNIEENVEVKSFPKVQKEIIRKFCVSSYDNSIDTTEFGIVPNIKDSDENIWFKKPESLKLYDYQTEAISVWEENGFRGIFDMATGTGKTLTGLSAVSRLTEKVSGKLAVVIVCPYQHLVEQWIEDVLEFNKNPIVGYSASSQKDWKSRLEEAVRDQKLKVRNREFFVFVCTNATFASEFVQSQLGKIRSSLLLVVDEAHNFGAEYLSRLLNERYTYRLALSATLERHNDEEGTKKLKDFFGMKCIEYSLERAINEKKLTKYKYYPLIISLNDVERNKYLELTYEIGKCLIGGRKGQTKLSERGKRLALERARLVAGAEDKISVLEKYIKPYTHEKHILVYCGATKLLREDQDYTEVDDDDLRQIDVVTDLLGNKLDMKVSQFTSKEGIAERGVLKEEFAAGDNLQALIAIKCLDEGVNIPQIRTAFILASTTNPKEYIQRRGRVLRTAPGKEYAEIFDFITLPRPLDEVSSLTEDQMKRELTLVKNELCRAEEFARISINMIEAEAKLDDIKEAYAINDYLITFEEEYDYA